MKRVPPFATEADLCRAFLDWAQRSHPEVAAFPEWADWDILLVLPGGFQLGIQAKLRLNAEVILQAAPDRWNDGRGPDYRGVLVPATNPLSAMAEALGLVVFRPFAGFGGRHDFHPDLEPGTRHGQPWLDFNPATRPPLPQTATDAIAGSPCPVRLTPWKLRALAVLAELRRGPITTKRMRQLGVDPSRWLSGSWLVPAATRGEWVRGEKCPPFDAQHPSAFAAALAGPSA